MNCYSCPGAKGSCPIGSLQAVIGNSNYKFSYYIVGFMFLIGVLIGRFVCGWAMSIWIDSRFATQTSLF